MMGGGRREEGGGEEGRREAVDFRFLFGTVHPDDLTDGPTDRRTN